MVPAISSAARAAARILMSMGAELMVAITFIPARFFLGESICL
jgi:hypothetical protein